VYVLVKVCFLTRNQVSGLQVLSRLIIVSTFVDAYSPCRSSDVHGLEMLYSCAFYFPPGLPSRDGLQLRFAFTSTSRPC
jgi:hypothetical protein